MDGERANAQSEHPVAPAEAASNGRQLLLLGAGARLRAMVSRTGRAREAGPDNLAKAHPRSFVCSSARRWRPSRGGREGLRANRVDWTGGGADSAARPRIGGSGWSGRGVRIEREGERETRGSEK